MVCLSIIGHSTSIAERLLRRMTKMFSNVRSSRMTPQSQDRIAVFPGKIIKALKAAFG
jgi:hypothetical protein